MQTSFSDERLRDPQMATSEAVIRKCVHCGFCTATCPTYVLLGDELDSPRGRIYLMKDMLETGRKPDAELVKHVDRCLSCLSCMTTCPSGVNYMHLVDHARHYIYENYDRPWADRMLRRLLAQILPYPNRFRLALGLAPLGRRLTPLIGKIKALAPIGAMLALAPDTIPAAQPEDRRVKTAYTRRVLILKGCAEQVLRPQYRAAATRLLNRLGFGVDVVPEEKCCGALVQHMGMARDALRAARRNIDAWSSEIAKGDVAAIVITASGCGTVIKDYGHLLRDDPDYAQKAARCSALVRDISEFIAEHGIDTIVGNDDPLPMPIAYHPACSLQHGQQLGDMPKKLLQQAGFEVRVPDEAHLCCGSAGTYNILQPEIARQLAVRKAAHIGRLGVPVVATTNIGCAMQIQQASGLPVVHVVELLDWATGGPLPEGVPDEISRQQGRT